MNHIGATTQLCVAPWTNSKRLYGIVIVIFKIPRITWRFCCTSQNLLFNCFEARWQVSQGDGFSLELIEESREGMF